jgi:hypothetical protein
MHVTVILAALLAAGLGWALTWFFTRGWYRVQLQLPMIAFPKLCPRCLSTHADDSVDEKSPARQTANYVVAHRLEWWRARVPHCSRCAGAIFRNQVIGVLTGGACALAVLFVAPPDVVSFGAFSYILFGYPAYAILNTVGKGIVLGLATSADMTVRVKHAKYFMALLDANEKPSDRTAVPLPEDKGVWLRRKSRRSLSGRGHE